MPKSAANLFVSVVRLTYRRSGIACYISVAVAACCFPAAVATADWYVGGSAGKSRIDVTATEIEQGFLIDDAFVATGTTLDKTDRGWKAYAGYRIGELFALEGGYADLGKATFHTTVVDAPSPLDALAPFPIQATATADGLQVSALVHIPLPGPFSLIARAGAFRWQAEFTEQLASTGTTRVDRTEEEVDALRGIGLHLRFNDALAARVEWERLEDVGKGIGGREGRDIDFVSAGVVFDF